MAGAGLAADGGHPVPQRRVSVDVDGVAGPDRDHSVVGHDGEQAARGQTLDHRFHQAVDLAQLHAPRFGTGAVQVAQQVEFAVVAVAEPTAYQCRAHIRGQITESQHADIAAAAQHGPGQTGAGEFGAGHDADRDAGGRRPFERRRQRLHVFWHQRVAHVLAPRMRPPAQRVEQPGLRQPEGHADQSVLAGAAAGSDSGEPGDRGRREPDLQRWSPQPGQYGRVMGEGVQQFGAETVDQQHAGAGERAG